MPIIIAIMQGIAAVISSGMVIFGFIIMICKPLRNKIKTWVKRVAVAEDEKVLEKIDEKIDKVVDGVTKTETRIDLLCEVDREQLKNFIKNVYYKYLPKKTLPIHEKHAVISQYGYYKKLGGNHFIEEIYNEMMKWDVIE